MRIRELEDVLRLVDELPESRQQACVNALESFVEDWRRRG